MTPDTRAALRTRARAEVRCEVALKWYRYERNSWWHQRSEYSRHIAIVARSRWTTLASLLAADAVETTVAA